MTQHIVLFGILLAAGAADPFNPGAYLGAREEAKAEAAVKSAGGSAGGLTAHSIYRLNGLRFHRLASAAGAVYLPGASEVPEIREEFVLCEEHLKLLGGEVLRLRDGMPITPEIKAKESLVLGMIAKCKDGRVKSPTLTITRPDGAVVEIKAKESRDTQRSALDTRDDAFDEKNEAKQGTTKR